MKLLCAVICLFVYALCPSFSTEAAAQGRWQRAKICIDTENDAVRLRRNCKEPRFVEVTPAQLAPTVELVTDSIPISLSSFDDTSGSSVTCPEGKVVTGGGASVVDNLGLNLKTSIPRIALNGWQATVTALRNNASGTMNIYAICSTGISIYEEEEE